MLLESLNYSRKLLVFNEPIGEQKSILLAQTAHDFCFVSFFEFVVKLDFEVVLLFVEAVHQLEDHQKLLILQSDSSGEQIVVLSHLLVRVALVGEKISGRHYIRFYNLIQTDSFDLIAACLSSDYNCMTANQGFLINEMQNSLQQQLSLDSL